jgi:hypothetical protein
LGVAPAARQAQEPVPSSPVSVGAGKHVLLDGSQTKPSAQSVENAHENAQVPLDGTHKNGLHGVLSPFWPTDDWRSSEQVVVTAAGRQRCVVSSQV